MLVFYIFPINNLSLYRYILQDIPVQYHLLHAFLNVVISDV